MGINSVRRRSCLFRALGPHEPPATIELQGEPYVRVEVFKHDSWAATVLYRGERGSVVCKFNRRYPLLCLPGGWLGRWLGRRESRLLRLLKDHPNVPAECGPVRANGRILRNAVAHEYIEGHPLGANERVSRNFFPELRGTLQHLHERGIAYVDLHKRENVLVGVDGKPYLIDFQVCFRLDESPLIRVPFGWLLRILQRTDLYHLDKHIARNRPDQAGSESTERPKFIRAHRVFAQPLRQLRRRFLVLLGIRSGRGMAVTELEPEDAVRRELALPQNQAAGESRAA